MITEWVAVLRIVVSGLLGAAVGFERQRYRKPAGLRTHMLVAIGSALFVVAALLIIADPSGSESVIRLDLLRVVAAIATGIGFLGAGAILRGREEVHGLTTAAGIWVTAGIGLATGLGFYILAVGATVVTVVVIALLGTEASAISHESRQDPDS